MYTTIKNVQILIALLKKYGIANVVISPGGNNIPIIHSIEADKDFKCYSVVDERSAAYFAMGLAQQLEEPVALVCTSGTAVCNYLPGVTEAKYQRVPLVVITSDRSPYMLDQLETQKIDQMQIFGQTCKKEVNLPIVKTEDDEWYCGRLINEALLEMRHHGNGPVHINVPTTGNPMDYSASSLPEVKKIKRYIFNENSKEEINDTIEVLKRSDKILLIFGEDFRSDFRLASEIALFCEKTKAVCLVDYMSNLKYDQALLAYRITESMVVADFEELVPDVVITFGNNILSNNLKYFMRQYKKKYIHWCVDEAGEIRDVFKALDTVYECIGAEFLSILNKNLPDVSCDSSYRDKWNKAYQKTKYEKIDYSSLRAIQMLADGIPNEAVVHLGILNSTRGFHFFETNKNLKVYSNIGALGIDGSMSTFIGHSFATEKLCFLIVGDLSFFYDMNALGIRGIGKNVRVLLLNNGGGAEFHFNMGKDNIETLDDYISVKHQKSARAWAETLGFEYCEAHNEEELDAGVKTLINEEINSPVLLEVYLDMENDARITKGLLADNLCQRSTSAMIKGKVKSILGVR